MLHSKEGPGDWRVASGQNLTGSLAVTTVLHLRTEPICKETALVAEKTVLDKEGQHTLTGTAGTPLKQPVNRLSTVGCKRRPRRERVSISDGAPFCTACFHTFSGHIKQGKPLGLGRKDGAQPWLTG